MPELQEQSEARRRKTFRLRQSRIDLAMKALGTRTEPEAIEQALDFVYAQGEVIELLDPDMTRESRTSPGPGS